MMSYEYQDYVEHLNVNFRKNRMHSLFFLRQGTTYFKE